MNSQMRRIDLFCKLVSPLAIALIHGFSAKIAIMVTLATNLASVLVEYALVAWTYKSVPSLGVSSQRNREVFENDRSSSSEAGVSLLLISQYRQLLESVKLYMSQRAFLASISLSFLYLTVLSFSGQMVTYLLATGFTSTTIGWIRTISVLVEISATWLAPKIMTRLGPIRAGMWFLSWQTMCLSITVSVFWISLSPIWAASVLVGGVIASRVGLWGFDLSAQIIIQEVSFVLVLAENSFLPLQSMRLCGISSYFLRFLRVGMLISWWQEIESEYRGSFSTLESSVQNLFELCSFTSTIVFARPDQFRYPALVSVVAVYIAEAIYAKFVKGRRGHLLHKPYCLKGRESHKYEALPLSRLASRSQSSF